MKRISPKSIKTPVTSTPRSENSSPSDKAAQNGGDAVDDAGAVAAAVALATDEHAKATAPEAPDGWVAPVCAEALLLRGRLALLDGKLRVCFRIFNDSVFRSILHFIAQQWTVGGTLE